MALGSVNPLISAANLGQGSEQHMGAGPQGKGAGQQELEFGAGGADGVALQQADAVEHRVAQLAGGAEGGGADRAEGLIAGFGEVGIEPASARPSAAAACWCMPNPSRPAASLST